MITKGQIQAFIRLKAEVG